jgi:SAM-dependent methyltransferase
MLGWDLAQLGPRISIDGPAWDFDAIVVDHARAVATMLDIDTGGGEWLASLEYRPAHTAATESWPPNLDVARERLEPLGITVAAADAVPDNVDPQDGVPPLPCESDAFGLVTGRHAAYVPREIARVVAPGGTFLTQQIGGDYGDFHEALGRPRPPIPRRWTLALAAEQLEAAGFAVADGAEGEEMTTFADADALAWYLTTVPWTVGDFSRAELENVQLPLRVRLPAFWLKAVKP